MPDLLFKRPEPTEYFSYYEKYVRLVPETDIIAALQSQLQNTLTLLRGISAEKAVFRYAAGKWSIKEVVGHLIDSERVFAYRALRFARSDQAPLAGFEQDDYVRAASFDDYPWNDLIDDFEQARKSSVSLLRHLKPEAWQRRGVANNNPITVRALAYIIVGHERHHLEQLRARYLSPSNQS